MNEPETATRDRRDGSIRVEQWSPMKERPIITVQQHILQEQKRFPGASGEFSWLLSGITLATKMIQAKVRRAGLTDILAPKAASTCRARSSRSSTSTPTRSSCTA